jgi:hypothetical protein
MKPVDAGGCAHARNCNPGRFIRHQALRVPELIPRGPPVSPPWLRHQPANLRRWSRRTRLQAFATREVAMEIQNIYLVDSAIESVGMIRRVSASGGNHGFEVHMRSGGSPHSFRFDSEALARETRSDLLARLDQREARPG